MVKAEGMIRDGDIFPLGEDLLRGGRGSERAALPFGLRYATTPAVAAAVRLDFSRIAYDPEQQIAVVTEDDGTLLPAMRHTSTQTKTETGSHDRTGPDDDTDTTGT
jgi:putative ATP-grasp target RiPP